VFKFFRKRSLWLPTWQTLLISATFCVLATWFVVANIHPFLSLTDRAEGANILVAEGWVDDYILEGVARDFEVGKPYDFICTTGATLDSGHYLSEYKTYAELAAQTLMRLGVPAENIIIAPSPASIRDRTYHSALGFLEKRNTTEIQALRNARAIDVLTSGVHGRRSRAVFQKILGDEVDVGVIAADSADYDADRWFTSSAGVKAVIQESISLTYEWFGVKER
jgi:hypothetical protein